MLQKASFLNKSIIKSDLRRFWYLGALNALVSFFLGVFLCMDSYLYREGHIVTKTIPNDFYIMMVVGMIFAALTTVAVFNYLTGSARASFAHALPLSRKTLYVSHITSAFILSAASGVINTIAFYLYMINDNVASHISAIVPLKMLFAYLVYSALIIALTAFTTMLTGSGVATAIFTLCFALIPLATEGFIRYFLEINVYGYEPKTNDMYVENLFYLSFEKLLSFNVISYVIIILALFIVGYFLYKYRKIECAGEVVAYLKMRPIFIYMVAIFTGMASYLYFGAFFTHNIFFLLPFGIIGIIIAFMLSRKSFSLKGVQKSILIYVLFVLIIFVTIKFDITGYERRIPDISKIESVEMPDFINYNHLSTYHYMGNDSSYQPPNDDWTYYYEDPYDIRILDGEEIENVVNLHSHMLENRPEGDFRYMNRALTIKYNLKNGKTLVRQYYPSYYNDREVLEPIVNSTKGREMLFEIANGVERKINSITLYDARTEKYAYFYPSNAELNQLYEAFKKDLMETPYDELIGVLQKEPRPFKTINFNYTQDGHFSDGTKLYTDVSLSLEYRISPKYKNVNAVIQSLNLDYIDPSADEIEKITVSVLNDYYEDVKVEPAEAGYDLAITQREDIEEIYAFLCDIYTVSPERSNKTILINLHFKNGINISRELNFPNEYYPEAIKMLLGE